MTAPATPPDWDAIARYLAGESTTGEADVVRSWLDAHPDERAVVERLDAAAILEPADVDVEAALARVHQRMTDPQRPSLRLERGGNAAGASRRKSTVAVITAVVAAAAAAFVLTQTRSRTPGPVTVAMKHYATGVGRRDSVLLADGSLVILGPQSTLEVPGTFGVGDRTVTLTGDAYFDVRHDASKPFRVHAGSAVIEDIGTTFTIESDAAAMATISVVSGSVRLSRASAPDGVVLAAGDRGSLGTSGDASVERNVVRPEDTEWISGKLAFRDAPLSRVAAEMERWYGIKLRVADSSMLDRKVTTSFEGESVDKALQILELTIGAKINRQGDSAVIFSLHGSRSSR